MRDEKRKGRKGKACRRKGGGRMKENVGKDKIEINKKVRQGKNGKDRQKKEVKTRERSVKVARIK